MRFTGFAAGLCIAIITAAGCASAPRSAEKRPPEQQETLPEPTGGREMLRYYATQGVITDPGKYEHLYDGLPSGVPELSHSQR